MIYLYKVIQIMPPKLQQICPNLKLRQNWNLFLKRVLSSVSSKNPDSVPKLKSKLPKLVKRLVFTTVCGVNPVCIKTHISKDIGELLSELSYILKILKITRYT